MKKAMRKILLKNNQISLNEKKKRLFNRIIIFLLYQCNLRCIFCGCGQTEIEQKKILKKDYIKIINKFKDAQVNYVVLTGGEPTLLKDLPGMIHYTRQKLGCKITLNTNGTNLNPDMIKKLIQAGLNTLKTSLHSFDSNIHDKITGVRGSWERLIRNIQDVNKINSKINNPLNIKTNTVVLNRNYKDIYKLVDIGFQNNIKFMQFTLSSLKKCWKDNDFFRPLDRKQLEELYFKIYPKLLKKAVEKNVAVEIRPIFVELVNMPQEDVMNELRQTHEKFDEELGNYSRGLFGRKFYENYRCYEASSGLVINPRGGVRFCCAWPNGEIGNILTDNLRKIMFTKNNTKPEGCNRCGLFLEANKRTEEIK